MKRMLITFICGLLTLCMVGCNKVDPNYGASETQNSTVETVSEEPVAVPEIKSDDEIMPNYFDISLYDEENYSNIYLGKKFEYKITYAGSELTVPTTYKNMVKQGWTLVESDEYNEDSQILAGKSLRVNFINPYDKQIVAVFHNSKDSSVSLKKCALVKFIVPENVFEVQDSIYGQFWVNGVGNESAITDIIEYLGSPSHFYCVDDGQYYLDYFITEKDKRSGITVYVDTQNDRVNSIEFSYY